MNIQEINTELQNLWNKHLNRKKVYAPMQYEEPIQGGLVFVGMNPSFSEKGWKSLLQLTETPELDPRKFLQWPSPQDFNIELSHDLEALARNHYPFFAPHWALSSALNLKWIHFDIFAYRETKQLTVRSLVLSGGKEIELTDFGKGQFELFKNLLKLAQPKAVIVVNALASQIYLKMRREEIKFDKSTGYYSDSFGKDNNFPVFFSGMLTGTRALDRFSKDRLFWQVASALGQKWEPNGAAELSPVDIKEG